MQAGKNAGLVRMQQEPLKDLGKLDIQLNIESQEDERCYVQIAGMIHQIKENFA